ncbi:MAG: HD family phosphohydrolase [Petrotogales bacterium]
MVAEKNNNGTSKRHAFKFFTLKNITNFVLFPVLTALLSRIAYMKIPHNPFSFFFGAVLFWIIFGEILFIRSTHFSLHRAYRYTVFSVALFGAFLNSFLPSLVSNEYALAIVPIFLSVSIITVLAGFEVGLGTGLFLSYLASVSMNFSFEHFLLNSVMVFFTVLSTRKLLRRINIAKAGFFVGIMFSAVLFTRGLIDYNLNMIQIGIGLLNPVISSIVTIGIIPYIESVSRIYSDVGLLELGSLSHPLLKSLSLNAPGTYYHSITLANLSEAAAEKISANAILARVAAYFHDIGKLKRPQYFTENQSGNNPHNSITPSMSNIVINEHVKRGVELAKKHRLPKLIEDVIREHHGTRVKKYFYHKAKEEREDSKDEYRYPGPKPQFPESGIIMLADSAEAASKSIKEPTPGKIHDLVEDIVNGVYNERQLDECGLTLSDLEQIIEAFTNVLTNMNRGRVEYPKERVDKVVSSSEDSGDKQDKKQD